MNVVDNVIARNFRDEAEKRGYIVVVPAAPNDQLFFEGGERIFPEFLKQILADYKIPDNKFHIAGPSNGGIASFHVASLNPEVGSPRGFLAKLVKADGTVTDHTGQQPPE